MHTNPALNGSVQFITRKACSSPEGTAARTRAKTTRTVFQDRQQVGKQCHKWRLNEIGILLRGAGGVCFRAERTLLPDSITALRLESLSSGSHRGAVRSAFTGGERPVSSGKCSKIEILGGGGWLTQWGACCTATVRTWVRILNSHAISPAWRCAPVIPAQGGAEGRIPGARWPARRAVPVQ